MWEKVRSRLNRAAEFWPMGDARPCRNFAEGKSGDENLRQAYNIGFRLPMFDGPKTLQTSPEHMRERNR